jgi:hypothetical protein
MADYKARVEIRQQGALGLFFWTEIATEALNEEDACANIRAVIEAEHLEARGFCLRKTEFGIPVTPFSLDTDIRELGTLFEKALILRGR